MKVRLGTQSSTRASAVMRRLAVLLAAAMVLTACASSEGSTDESGQPEPAAETAAGEAVTEEPTEGDEPSAEPADGGEVSATIAQAFQTDLAPSELPPLVVEALERVGSLSQEQLDVAYECWEASTCEVPGGGDVVLGIADGFGDNTWRKVSKMEAILQALTYPEVGQIIYTNASFDLATMQSNVRSLVAQGADAIVAYNDFGTAMVSTFANAQQNGVPVSLFVGPTPDAPEDAIRNQVTSDVCDNGREMADAAVELAGEQAKVAFFNGTPGNPQGATWNQCAEERFAEAAPDVEVTFTADTDWTPAGAYEAANALIASDRPVDVILYDYADPLPQVVEAFGQAGEAPPAMVTWTMNNELLGLWEDAQGTDQAFDLRFTNGLNWAARVSVTAMMNAIAGEEIPAEVIYPQPFVSAESGMFLPDKPGDFPGSALIPESLVERMLG